MRLTVHTVTPTPGATVWTAVGVNDDGDQVTFGGDWRPMRDLEAAIEQHGPLDVEINRWQILSTVPRQPKSDG